jgi:hypothetical protein
MFQRLSSTRAKIVSLPVLLGAVFLSASLSMFVFYDTGAARGGEPISLATVSPVR